MGENSKIEWTTHTFNPWIGCQKVSPGCDHCYAEALMDKRLGRVVGGRMASACAHRQQTGRSPHSGLRRRQRPACVTVYSARHSQTGSTTRCLSNGAATWPRIEDTPELDWLLLTKRIENFERLSPWRPAEIPPNVWLGVTAEDQDSFDRRWPILADIRASVSFISYEPAIGLID